MAKMRHRFPTITEKGGLEPHMVSLGYNYDLFVSEVTEMIIVDKRINKSKLHRKFGASTITIGKWVDWLKQDKPDLFLLITP